VGNEVQIIQNTWIAIFVATIFGIVAILGMFMASFILAPKKKSADKLITYESGIRPTPFSWSQIHVRYYIFGILFLIFDVEAVFIFPWAAIFNEIKENVNGEFTLALANLVFYEMMAFIGILILGIIYAWKKGVLEWK
jgi:NADH-quinone oxidoreductase subunit A